MMTGPTCPPRCRLPHSNDASTECRRLPVDALWEEFACSRVWGPELPSPAALVASAEFQRACDDLHLMARLPSAIRLHAEQIASRVIARREDDPRLEPVLHCQRNFVDDLHWLAALYLEKKSFVDVVERENLFLQTSSGMSDVFGDELVNPDNLGPFATNVESARPFPHMFVRNALRAPLASTILSEIENVPWEFVRNDLYEQYVQSLLDLDSTLQPGLRMLRRAALSFEFASTLAKLANTPPLSVADIACHKSLAGQRIGIHTDFSDNRELCRLTLHFTSQWTGHEGGVFALHETLNSTNALVAYPPLLNSGVLFKISNRSFHSVTPVKGNTPRYSIVISMKRA